MIYLHCIAPSDGIIRFKIKYAMKTALYKNIIRRLMAGEKGSGESKTKHQSNTDVFFLGYAA